MCRRCRLTGVCRVVDCLLLSLYERQTDRPSRRQQLVAVTACGNILMASQSHTAHIAAAIQSDNSQRPNDSYRASKETHTDHTECGTSIKGVQLKL